MPPNLWRHGDEQCCGVEHTSVNHLANYMACLLVTAGISKSYARVCVCLKRWFYKLKSIRWKTVVSYVSSIMFDAHFNRGIYMTHISTQMERNLFHNTAQGYGNIMTTSRHGNIFHITGPCEGNTLDTDVFFSKGQYSRAFFLVNVNKLLNKKCCCKVI